MSGKIYNNTSGLSAARTLPANGPPRQNGAPPNLSAGPAASDLTSFVLSVIVCAVVLLAFMLNVDELQHWLVIPVFLCGVLITGDAIDWLRGRINLFDPVGLMGLFGFNFFFLAPLAHVTWNAWPAHLPSLPEDWRPWLGGMAVLNAMGLVVYRLTRNFFTGRDVWKTGQKAKKRSVVWVLDPKRAMNLLAIGLVAALVLQIYTYVQMGGIYGYMGGFGQAHSSTGADFLDGGPRVAGASVISYITGLSESFPIFAMMGFAIYVARRKRTASLSTVLVALMVFFVLQIFFGGLRGSRSNTIFALMWAVGIVHFWIRPISKKLVFAGLCALFVFVWMYGFYKQYGVNTLAALREKGSISELMADQRRGWQAVLLGDLARTDVQSLILYRLQNNDWDYELVWGRTYYAAVASVVPRFLWPDRPESKKKEGTDILHGNGFYRPDRRTSRVFGLAGEVMFNYGPYAVPFAFLVPSLLISRTRRALYTWARHPTLDARVLLLPLAARLCMSLFIGDLDNCIYALFKNGTFPFLILLFSCRRRVVSNSVQLPSPAHAAAARVMPKAAPRRIAVIGQQGRA